MKYMLVVGLVAALLVSACMYPPQDDTTVVDTGADTRSSARDTTVDGETDTTVNVYEDNEDDVVYIYDDNEDRVVERRRMVVNNYYNNTTVVTRHYIIEAPSTRFESGEQVRNEDIARDFVEDTAGYRDGGSDIRMVGAQKLATNPPLLVYTFTYDAQGSQHVTQVVIMNGRVVSAITDDMWNEISQRPVSTNPALQGDVCGTDENIACASGLYCFRVSDEAEAAGYCLREQ